MACTLVIPHTHDVWVQTKATNEAHTKAVFDEWRAVFPTTPLYYSFGNHDSYPVDNFPTKGVTASEFNGDWLYGGTADMIAPLMNDSGADATFRENGRYAVKPMAGLKIIQINTNFAAP